MAITGFNHYNLRAPRPLLDELKAFYCDVVGMTLGPRPALRSFGYWLYIGGKDILHLSETRSDEVRALHVTATFDHIAFTCEDGEAMEAHLTRCQVPFETRVVAATGVKQIFFNDPVGNGIELNIAI